MCVASRTASAIAESRAAAAQAAVVQAAVVQAAVAQAAAAQAAAAQAAAVQAAVAPASSEPAPGELCPRAVWFASLAQRFPADKPATEPPKKPRAVTTHFNDSVLCDDGSTMQLRSGTLASPLGAHESNQGHFPRPL